MEKCNDELVNSMWKMSDEIIKLRKENEELRKEKKDALNEMIDKLVDTTTSRLNEHTYYTALKMIKGIIRPYQLCYDCASHLEERRCDSDGDCYAKQLDDIKRTVDIALAGHGEILKQVQDDGGKND